MADGVFWECVGIKVMKRAVWVKVWSLWAGGDGLGGCEGTAVMVGFVSFLCRFNLFEEGSESIEARRIDITFKHNLDGSYTTHRNFGMRMHRIVMLNGFEDHA